MQFLTTSEVRQEACAAGHIAPASGDPRHRLTAMERRPTIIDVAERAGIRAMQALHRVDRRTEHVPFAALDYGAGRRVATERPNDLITLGLRGGRAEIGRDAGRAFRVVSFGDIEEFAQGFPALTTVCCDIASFGEVIARMVLNGWRRV